MTEVKITLKVNTEGKTEGGQNGSRFAWAATASSPGRSYGAAESRIKLKTCPQATML